MTSRRSRLLFAASTLAVLVAPRLAFSQASCRFDEVEIEPKLAARVEAARIDRPFLSLRLDEGTLYPLRACDRRVGFLFVGDARAEVGSPGPQRAPLLHLYAPEELPGEVLLDAALLIGSDGLTEQLLAAAGPLEPASTPPEAFALVQARVAGFDRSRPGSWAPPGEVLAAPEPALGGSFVELRTRALRWFNPGRSLEVPSPWLTHLWAPSGAQGDPAEPGLWMRRGVGSADPLLFAAFPAPEVLAEQGTPFAQDDSPWPWELTQVTLAVSASGPVGPERTLVDLAGDARLSLVARHDAPRSLLLSLAQGMDRRLGPSWAPLDVLSVTEVTPNGEELARPWLRVGDRLWVERPAAPPEGERVELRIRYEGAVLETRGRTAVRVLGAEAWYPRTPGPQRHQVTMIAAAPRFWQIIASGHRIGEEDDGRVRTVTSRSPEPILGAALVFADARTEVYTPSSPHHPLVRVHRNPEQPALNAKIGKELAEWMERLERLLGPYPGTELEIVERGPGTLGYQELPGVIALGTFDSPPDTLVTSRVSSDSLLGAITRQWLLGSRGVAHDHDAWLAEGLLTLARCLVLEEAGSSPRCHGELAQLRRAWVEQMSPGALGTEDLAAREVRAGAVWLDASSGAPWGNRMWRGPLLLHGLRLLLGDEVIRSTLRAVAAQTEPLALEPFLVQIQSLAQRDLRAYVYGWAFNTPPMPVARLDYALVESEGGWRIEGSGFIDDGRDTDPKAPLPMPLLLRFKVGSEWQVQRLLLSERSASFTITDLPEKPSQLTLDPGKTFPGMVDVRRVQ